MMCNSKNVILATDSLNLLQRWPLTALTFIKQLTAEKHIGNLLFTGLNVLHLYRFRLPIGWHTYFINSRVCTAALTLHTRKLLVTKNPHSKTLCTKPSRT